MISTTVKSISKDESGSIALDEIGVVMRYIGHFLPEGELADIISKELQNESKDGSVPYTVFERVMLRLLSDHEYVPDEESTIIEAFRAIDTEGNGWVDVELVKEYLTAGNTGFREKEINEFVEYAKDREEPSRIYYEDYAYKLTKYVKKHLAKLYN